MKEYISNRNFRTEYKQKILDQLLVWKTFIKANKNFSFIKFGDGELFSIGADKHNQEMNCDKHSFRDGDLPKKLKDAWLFFNEYNNKYNNIYFAEWRAPEIPGYRPMDPNSVPQIVLRELESIKDFNITYVNYEILLQNTLSQEKYDFFEAIKNTRRKKVFVGPQRLHGGVSNWLKVDKCIEVPIRNVIDEYDRILEDVYLEVEKDAIFMFSCSMPANSFIHRALELENELTCLDIGSGFDMLFYGFTREGQIQRDTLKNYYGI